MITLTDAEAKLFLALLNGNEPNITWVMEGGDPFGQFLSRYNLKVEEFGQLLNKLSEVEE